MKNLLMTASIAWFALHPQAKENDGSTASKKAEATSHAGTRKPVSPVLGGAALPEPVVKAITLKMTADQHEVTIHGQRSDKGTCSLDSEANPKRMTIKSTEGPNRGKTLLATYEMKNADSLQICYDLSGKKFPKEFKAPKGTQLHLVEYRRQEEKKTAPK